MKAALFWTVLIFAGPAFGSVSISREYKFSINTIKTVEKSLAAALNRDTEMQAYPVYYPIDEDNGISMWCPPHMPKSDGTGCSLNFILKLESLSVLIKKSLALSFSSEQVANQLKNLNPNITDDHQHFGSPFEPKETFGSHFFCQPEGPENLKTWECYLFVNEFFGA